MKEDMGGRVRRWEDVGRLGGVLEEGGQEELTSIEGSRCFCVLPAMCVSSLWCFPSCPNPPVHPLLSHPSLLLSSHFPIHLFPHHPLPPSAVSAQSDDSFICPYTCDACAPPHAGAGARPQLRHPHVLSSFSASILLFLPLLLLPVRAS